MHFSLILVPSHAGDEAHPSSAGPRRTVEAGAAERLMALGHTVTVHTAELGGPFRDTVSSTGAVNRRVATLVRSAMAAEEFPLVLAGSCVTAQGVLAGFDHSQCGVVWVDAHPDFNTPDTTVTGFFPGMSLSVVTGHCYPAFWAQVGDATPIAEEHVVLLGMRDAWQVERDRLDRSAIQVVEWRDGEAQGDVRAALDNLAARVPEAYLHIDFDGFAPEVAPGIVDEPVPGGLSQADVELIIRATAERFRIRAATLATFTPNLDRGDKTLGLALAIIELLGEGMRGLRAGARQARGVDRRTPG